MRVFEAIDAEALIALPPRAFELTTWSIGTVGVDAHLKVSRALYSVPWRLIGARLHARPPAMWCRSSPGPMWWPPTCAARAGAPPTSPTTRRKRSPSLCAPRPGVGAPPALVGPACESVIADFMADNAIHHLRSGQGVLGLRDKHGCARPLREFRRRGTGPDTFHTPGARPSRPRAPLRAPSRSALSFDVVDGSGWIYG